MQVAYKKELINICVLLNGSIYYTISLQKHKNHYNACTASIECMSAKQHCLHCGSQAKLTEADVTEWEGAPPHQSLLLSMMSGGL